MKLLILSLLLILSFSIRDDPKYWSSISKEKDIVKQQKKLYAQTQLWFNQIVDHTNYQTISTWRQRYWVVDNFFNPNVGPVFLYICGEYVCSGVRDQRQWVVTMAQKLQGLILVLEHRYYGQSMPFGEDSLKLQNMVHLTSEQALSDLAYFIQQMRNTHTHKITDNTPFITVGGSYPGALSAWFRYKYPHLTIGAIASSAVVLAVENFRDYDQQIYFSTALSGDYCYQAINASNARVEQILKSSQGITFKAQFLGGQKLTDQQFLYFWIDSLVGFIQYGQRTNLCDNLKNKTVQQQQDYFVQVAKDNGARQYGAYYLKNLTYIKTNDQAARAWNYQCCTQFGYWQTASDRHPLRSSRVNIDFFKKFCNDVFGNNLWPQVERKNIQYGGINLQASKLLMVNGVQDPWRWASLQQSRDQIVSRVANCTNCAHCVDLYTPKDTDSAELKKIRDQQYLNVVGWVQNHWNQKIQSKEQITYKPPKSLQTLHRFIKISQLRLNKKVLNDE